jgi:hypothetical protein
MTIATSPWSRPPSTRGRQKLPHLAPARPAGVAFDADQLAGIAPGEDAHSDEDAGWLQLVGQGCAAQLQRGRRRGVLAYRGHGMLTWARVRRPPPSGPATSATSTSRSTATIERKAAVSFQPSAVSRDGSPTRPAFHEDHEGRTSRPFCLRRSRVGQASIGCFYALIGSLARL